MPTFEVTGRFWSDFASLPEELQGKFLAARDLLVADLRLGERPRPSLRVKRYQRRPGVWEMSWDTDGRALFEYGNERVAGQPHIVWLRIGTHDIFRNP